MRTDTTRKQFARSELRLPSDLTDARWADLEPLFPASSHRGRPPIWSYRQIVETLLYLLRGGLPWRMLPPELCHRPAQFEHQVLAVPQAQWKSDVHHHHQRIISGDDPK